MTAPLKLSLRTSRILSLLVLGGIGVGYLGGAIAAGPDGTPPILFSLLRIIGLISAVLIFIEARGQLTQSSDAMLDERERALRDKAYVATHQIMVACLLGFFLWSILAKFIHGWMPGQEAALDLLSGFAISAMALPGIILAWQEQADDGEGDA